MKQEQIKEFPNYFINELGQVVNKQGKVKATFRQIRDGYEMVFLWKNNKAHNKYIHRLVAEHLIPNPENKPCVNHIDGNKMNNLITNLEWVTYSENSIHALKLGLKVPDQAEDVHNSLYTNEQIHEICKALQSGMRVRDVAEKFQVPRYLVKSISIGVTWKTISEGYNFPSRTRSISEDTVRWICKQIENGYTNMQILGMSTNPKVDRKKIENIRNKKTFQHISKDFNF